MIKFHGMVYEQTPVVGGFDENGNQIDRVLVPSDRSEVVPLIMQHGGFDKPMIVGEVHSITLLGDRVFASGEATTAFDKEFILLNSGLRVPVSVGTSAGKTEMLKAGVMFNGKELINDTIVFSNVVIEEVSIVDTPAITSAFIQKF